MFTPAREGFSLFSSVARQPTSGVGCFMFWVF